MPSSDLENVHVYEPTSPLLRRHVVHDKRSRDYALTSTAVPRRTVAWPRQGPIFDQSTYNGGKGVGCCTACAGLGLLMTSPFSRGGTYADADVLSLYHDETVADERVIPGVYPPDDTGSYSVALMSVLKKRGLIASYKHAFSLNAALAALQHGPITVGTVWLESMFEPRGAIVRVDKSSKPAGGHQYVIDAFHETGYVRITNSWGEQWGSHGAAWLAVPDLGYLLGQQGDVAQPVI